MATGDAIVVRLKNLENIEGADLIQKGKILGETIVTSKDNKEGDLGLLFDIETALSQEFASNNQLFRHSKLNQDKKSVGYLEDSARIRPIRLRGIKVSGLFLPINCLHYTGLADSLKEGDKFTELGAFKICEKYVPKQKEKGSSNQPKSIKVNYVPFFKEHFSTEHLMKSQGEIPVSPFVATIKIHGTSCRIGRLPSRNPTLLERLKNRSKNPNQKILNKFLKFSWFETLVKVIPNLGQGFTYRNVVGSRTVVKSVEGLFENPNQGFYGEDLWSDVAHRFFKDNLLENETIYFEICGYEKSGSTIMPSASTKKLEKFLDKEEYKKIKETYGETLDYTYGVPKGEQDVYVYRITMTNPQGEAIDLSWEQVKKRCEKLGVKHVPEIGTGFVTENKELIFNSGKYASQKSYKLEEIVEKIADNAVHNNTFPEGFCLRVEGYPNCKILKHKSYNFKCAENMIKDTGIVSLEENS